MDQTRELQRDAQLAATLEEAFAAQIDGRLKDLHTGMPGIIASFDPATQTAKVQPAIKRIFTDRGPVNLPLCVDVPVQFPGGGDFFLTFPVKAGDECWLAFSERAIDLWFELGSTQPPAEYRLHDLSDATAFVGINSKPRKISNFNSTDTELRDRARTVRVTMKPDGTIEQHNPGGTMTMQPGGKLLIDMPQVEMTGTLKVVGGITGEGGAAISGGTGFALTGGTLTHNSKNIGSTHTHSGVTTGIGNTGQPN